MTPATAQSKQAEDVLIGVLAVMAIDGHTSIRINDKSFHAAFGAALEVLRKASGDLPKLARSFYRDAISKTYEKLDDALITAEHYGMVKIFNPTFEMMEIAITPRVANQLLDDWTPDERKAIERAAAEFRSRAVHC